MRISKGQKKENFYAGFHYMKIVLFCLLYVSMVLFEKETFLKVKAAENADAMEYISELEVDTLVETRLHPIDCRVAIYKFVPKTSGEYVFYAISDRDEETAATLYNSAGSLITMASSGKRGDFALKCELAEGGTYYFGAQYSSSSDTIGTILVGIKQALSVDGFENSQEFSGNTDGVVQSIDKETKSVKIRFQPEHSGYYSIFSKDYCGAVAGCKQGCVYEGQGCVCEEQGQCLCLNDLKIEIYTQSMQEGGELELYKYEESDEENGFLAYAYFDETKTYYIEISSVDGLKDGKFVLCIGKDWEKAYVKQIDITKKTEGYLEDNTQDLFYKFQPEEDGTYRWKSANGWNLYMTLYDSNMQIIEQTPEWLNDFDVKVKMKKGNTYYVKMSIESIVSCRFEFQVELVKEEDKGQNTEKPDETKNPSTNTDKNTQTQQPVMKKVSVSAVNLKAIGSKVYTGKKLKPSVTLKYNGKTLVKGKDYTVSYSSNKNIGTAKVVIQGIGNYTGKRTATFKIIPAQAKIKKGKRSGKKLTLKWGKIKGAAGYEIKYANSSKFKKAKTKTVKSCKVTLKLKNKKKYYVKIRAYKKVGKQKVYGKYSKVKKY